MRNNTIDPHRILTILGAWPSIMGWMRFLNSDDNVAVFNAMAVLKYCSNGTVAGLKSKQMGISV